MDHTSLPFDRAAFDTACLCVACKGTGKRGRGKCGTCDGDKDAGLDHPRIRFNWGYHDAWSQAIRGRARALVYTGPQNEQQVSPEHNYWYAAGYAHGLRDALAAAPAGTTLGSLSSLSMSDGLVARLKAARPETSEPAWLGWAGFKAH
jgi:hypothetical protein